MTLDEMLLKMVEAKASDLFITVGKPPCIKANGMLVDLEKEPLTEDKTKSLVLGLMDTKQQTDFLEKKEYNFAISTKNSGRFRVSAFFERFHVGAVFRSILTVIPQLKEMELPSILGDLAMIKRGMVIVAGATGVGKSTTMAAMIGHRNRNSIGHIVTIEDPIEFVHRHDKCIITQREVGVDTESYGIALKNTLRQAPDVILIGEIRSSDTMEYAIQFAETGHLCVATLHANNANQALDRIMSFFPAIKHAQIWLELSLNLKAIVGQQLLPRIGDHSRVPVIEILLNTPIVQQCIRKGDIDGLKEYMIKGRSVGMQTFDQALFDLYKNKKITYEDALKHADSENELRLMIKLDGGNSNDVGSLSGVKLQDE